MDNNKQPKPNFGGIFAVTLLYLLLTILGLYCGVRLSLLLPIVQSKLYNNKALRTSSFDIKDLLSIVETGDALLIQAVFVLTIVGLGLGLFLFKKYRQYWYGILESGFALLNCYYISTDLYSTLSAANIDNSNKPFSWLSAFAILYLVVRGFSNIDEGWRKMSDKGRLKLLVTLEAFKV